MTTATKLSAISSTPSNVGEKKLVSGENIALRMWDRREPTDDKPMRSHTYETVGYVIEGRAELKLEEDIIALVPGDSWIVPANTPHTYRILDTFTAIEATTPPAREHE